MNKYPTPQSLVTKLRNLSKLSLEAETKIGQSVTQNWLIKMIITT